jgi:hypothetical protein
MTAPHALTRHPGLVPGSKVPRATDKRLQLFNQPLAGPRHKAGVTVEVVVSVGEIA